MGHQGQRFPWRFEFAPTTKVGIPSHEEIDRPLQFVRALVDRRYHASSGIDLNSGAYRNKGANVWSCFRMRPHHRAPAMDHALAKRQRGLIRWRIVTERIRIHGAKQMLRLDTADVGQNKKFVEQVYALLVQAAGERRSGRT
jgi:hypothetical protein